jgi:putative colanic acid biosynthesis UDP-glucose lipid carrier transferase
MVVVVLVMLAFMSKTSANFSRLAVTTWFVVAPLCMIVARVFVRILLREMRRAGRNTRTLAVVGANAQGVRLIEKSWDAPWMGMRPLGIYDDVAIESTPDAIRPHLKGAVADLIKEVREGRVDYVYIALSMQEENRIVELVDAFADTTASVYVVPDMFVSDLLHAKWTNFHGTPAIRVYESPFMGVDGWVKKLEDFLLGTLFLAIAAIPMIAIGVAVKLTSPGAVIFKQRRYGLNGEVVEVWKFRTMSVCEDDGEIPQAKRGDPRITPLGKFLRETSLDEFPQLINVLQGRMSLVGPRPHAVAHNEQYRNQIHGYMLRHKVKPGITGWAQVNGWRGETDTLDKMEKRIEYDLEYIRNWSLLLDVKILWLTLFRGFSDKNAY